MKFTIHTISFMLGVLFAALFTAATAQHLPVYSALIYNPFIVNPAVAGSEKYVDINLDVRAQWLGIEGKPINELLSVQSSIDKNPLGIGAVFFNDQTGVISFSGGTASGSYHLNLTDAYHLSFGVSGGIVQSRLNFNKVKLADVDDAIISSYENKINPLVHSGLLLYSENFKSGISINNLLQYFNKENNDMWPVSKPSIHFYSGYTFELMNHLMTLEPFVYGLLSHNKKYSYQGWIKLNYGDLIKCAVGYRHRDALATSIGYSPVQQFEVNYFYEFPLFNRFPTVSGSHEIQLNYIIYYKPIYKEPKRRYKWIELYKSKGTDGKTKEVID